MSTKNSEKINELLQKNKNLKDLYKGRRAFVIGNGSSLKKQNLSPLKDEITIVSNSFYRHPLILEIVPTYYLLVDPSLWNEYSDLMQERFEGMQSLKNTTDFFTSIEANELIINNPLYNSFNISYLKYTTDYILEKEIDFSVPIPQLGQTVTLVGIMLAIFLGCNPIYLLGCDTDWTPESGSKGKIEHFYENSNAEKRLVESRINNIETHLSDPMFWINATRVIFEQYAIINKYAKIHSKEIFNATAGGKLEEFPRVRFSSLFRDLIKNISVKAIQAYNSGDLNNTLLLISQIEKIGEFPENIHLLKSYTLTRMGKHSEAKIACLKELECYPDNKATTNFLNNINRDLVNV